MPGSRHLREIGATEVDLYVEADNERALALYRRYGFSRVTADVMYAEADQPVRRDYDSQASRQGTGEEMNAPDLATTSLESTGVVEEADEAEGDGLPEDRFLDRELSWLAFNNRVLDLAKDAQRVPLLERAKFLAIFANNLDEFFMVRVAGLKRRIAAGVAVRSVSGLMPREVHEAILTRTRELVDRALPRVRGGDPARAGRSRASRSCAGTS